jgi:hypothetical protein
MKNSTLAIPAAAAAIPVNPNNPAINAITKKDNCPRQLLLPPFEHSLQ